MDDFRIDNGHVSSSFIRGLDIHPEPLVQKITAIPSGQTIYINTPVDGYGNVGEPSFGF